ncbi:MAG: hypothetical protein U1E29_11860 [Coriobacteriia bacterium]|nr:hypothetical protein [Coriobacteriia bacterium]
MKKLIALALAVLVTAPLVACGTADQPSDTVAMPESSSELKGEHYQDVMTRLEAAGFTSIETSTIDDLVLGWLTKDGEVEVVSVDGATDFAAGSRFPRNARIVIRYHTFPETESDEAAESSPVESKTPESADDPKPNSDLAKRTEAGVLAAFGADSFTELVGAGGMEDSLIPFIVSFEDAGVDTVKVTVQLTRDSATKEELEQTAFAIHSLTGEQIEDLNRVEVWTADGELYGVSNRWDVPLLNR